MRWNPALFTEPEYKSEQNGQLTIFLIEEEPPDPDDFELLTDFERAWLVWEKQFPNLAFEVNRVIYEPSSQAIQPNTIPTL